MHEVQFCEHSRPLTNIRNHSHLLKSQECQSLDTSQSMQCLEVKEATELSQFLLSIRLEIVLSLEAQSLHQDETQHSSLCWIKEPGYQVVTRTQWVETNLRPSGNR